MEGCTHLCTACIIVTIIYIYITKQKKEEKNHPSVFSLRAAAARFKCCKALLEDRAWPSCNKADLGWMGKDWSKVLVNCQDNQPIFFKIRCVLYVFVK